MSSKVAYLFFGLGSAAALVGMVSGPFGQTVVSITFSLAACVLAFFGIFLGFESWGEERSYERSLKASPPAPPQAPVSPDTEDGTQNS